MYRVPVAAPSRASPASPTLFLPSPFALRPLSLSPSPSPCAPALTLSLSLPARCSRALFLRRIWPTPCLRSGGGVLRPLLRRTGGRAVRCLRRTRPWTRCARALPWRAGAPRTTLPRSGPSSGCATRRRRRRRCAPTTRPNASSNGRARRARPHCSSATRAALARPSSSSPSRPREVRTKHDPGGRAPPWSSHFRAQQRAH